MVSRHVLATTLAGLLAAPGCTVSDVAFENLACDQGACPGTNLVCHPELGVCVTPVDVDCDGAVGLCPSRVATGDPCSGVNSFIPCSDAVSSCVGGCRTCEDGAWSECTDPECRLGTVFSCSSCSDNCDRQVANASSRCAANLDPPRCTYDDCDPGWADGDGDPSNGCECRPAGNESCDGVDNNCDGRVDEGFGLGASCGVGRCMAGVIECNADGSGVRCSTEPGGSADQSIPEQCNGTDDDCDGQVDEDFECIKGQDIACGEMGGITRFQICDPLACTLSQCSSPWLSVASVSVDSSGTTRVLPEFPALVRVPSSDISPLDMGTNGAGVRFYDSSSEDLLEHQVDAFDQDGETSFWVRAPSIPADGTATFSMFYEPAQTVAQPEAKQVWTQAFKAVFHLQEDFNGTMAGNLYADSSSDFGGASFSTPDGTSAATVPGVVGNALNLGKGETLDVPPGLGAAGPFTVSGWMAPATERFAWRRSVVLDTPTRAADTVVEIVLPEADFNFDRVRSEGFDIRIVLPDGTPLTHWIEHWPVADSEPGFRDGHIWVVLPSIGTDTFWLYYGNSEATTTASGFDAVLQPGLWRTGWTTDGSLGANEADMESRFSALDYSAAAGTDGGHNIDCSSRCNPQGSDRNYATLYEGWLIVAGPGDLQFGVDTEETAQLLLGGLAFKNDLVGSIQTLGAFGNNNGGNNFEDGATVTFPTAGAYRLNLRHEEDGTGGEHLHLYDSETDAVTYAPYPVSVFRHAPKTGSYVVTVGSAESNAVDLALGKSLVLGRYTGGARAVVNSVPIEAPVDGTSWVHLAVVYDGSDAKLYVDGVLRGSATVGSFELPGDEPLRIGDVLDQPFSNASTIDEVRFANTARSADWISLCYETVAGSAVTLTP